MKILLVDNYDSFTYNLAHLIKELGYTNVDIIRNDKIHLSDIEQYDKIILSPGPGIPSEAGLLLDVIKQYAHKKHILGVCLGHQAIGEAFGAELKNLEDVYHGVSTKIKITETYPLFEGLNGEIEVGRYHSWIVAGENFPTCLKVTAIDSNNQIMALSHTEFNVYGVQFHPESVLTKEGKTIVNNFLTLK